MEKAVEFFKDQLRGIRHGEISTGLLDTIRIEAYEQKLPLKQLAWTSPEKDRILISPYDISLLGAIDQALKSEGFNSYVFSKTQVVVSCPTRYGQDKDRIITQINKLAEEARVVIRNIRKKHDKNLMTMSINLCKNLQTKKLKKLMIWSNTK